MLLLLVLVLPLGCSDRWRSAAPRTVQLGESQLAFQATMVTLRQHRYSIAAYDPVRGFGRVTAKTDAEKGDPERLSSIELQTYADGAMRVSVGGRLVKADKGVMHRKLSDEVDQLVAAIHHNATAMYYAAHPVAPPPAPAATAPAVAPPAPPPREPSR